MPDPTKRPILLVDPRRLPASLVRPDGFGGVRIVTVEELEKAKKPDPRQGTLFGGGGGGVTQVKAHQGRTKSGAVTQVVAHQRKVKPRAPRDTDTAEGWDAAKQREEEQYQRTQEVVRNRLHTKDNPDNYPNRKGWDHNGGKGFGKTHSTLKTAPDGWRANVEKAPKVGGWRHVIHDPNGDQYHTEAKDSSKETFATHHAAQAHAEETLGLLHGEHTKGVERRAKEKKATQEKNRLIDRGQRLSRGHIDAPWSHASASANEIDTLAQWHMGARDSDDPKIHNDHAVKLASLAKHDETSEAGADHARKEAQWARERAIDLHEVKSRRTATFSNNVTSYIHKHAQEHGLIDKSVEVGLYDRSAYSGTRAQWSKVKAAMEAQRDGMTGRDKGAHTAAINRIGHTEEAHLADKEREAAREARRKAKSAKAAAVTLGLHSAGLAIGKGTDAEKRAAGEALQDLMGQHDNDTQHEILAAHSAAREREIFRHNKVAADAVLGRGKKTATKIETNIDPKLLSGDVKRVGAGKMMEIMGGKKTAHEKGQHRPSAHENLTDAQLSENMRETASRHRMSRGLDDDAAAAHKATWDSMSEEATKRGIKHGPIRNPRPKAEAKAEPDYLKGLSAEDRAIVEHGVHGKHRDKKTEAWLTKHAGKPGERPDDRRTLVNALDMHGEVQHSLGRRVGMDELAKRAGVSATSEHGRKLAQAKKDAAKHSPASSPATEGIKVASGRFGGPAKPRDDHHTRSFNNYARGQGGPERRHIMEISGVQRGRMSKRALSQYDKKRREDGDKRSALHDEYRAHAIKHGRKLESEGKSYAEIKATMHDDASVHYFGDKQARGKAEKRMAEAEEKHSRAVLGRDHAKIGDTIHHVGYGEGTIERLNAKSASVNFGGHSMRVKYGSGIPTMHHLKKAAPGESPLDDLRAFAWGAQAPPAQLRKGWVAQEAADAPEVEVEPASLMEDGNGRVDRGRFRCGGLQFQFRVARIRKGSGRATSRLGYLTATGPILPSPWTEVIPKGSWDAAMRLGRETAAALLAGRAPSRGVFTAIGTTPL